MEVSFFGGSVLRSSLGLIAGATAVVACSASSETTESEVSIADSATTESVSVSTVPETIREQTAWLYEWWDDRTAAEQDAYCTQFGTSSLSSPNYEEERERQEQVHSELVLDGTILTEFQPYSTLMFTRCN